MRCICDEPAAAPTPAPSSAASLAAGADAARGPHVAAQALRELLDLEQDGLAAGVPAGAGLADEDLGVGWGDMRRKTKCASGRGSSHPAHLHAFMHSPISLTPAS